MKDRDEDCGRQGEKDQSKKGNKTNEGFGEAGGVYILLRVLDEVQEFPSNATLFQ
jgi:hypothetical protein